MSNDEYQHQDFWNTKPKQLNSVCVEKGKNGECLMSAALIVLDMNEPVLQKGWFITGINHLKNKEDANKNV